MKDWIGSDTHLSSVLLSGNLQGIFYVEHNACGSVVVFIYHWAEFTWPICSSVGAWVAPCSRLGDSLLTLCLWRLTDFLSAVSCPSCEEYCKAWAHRSIHHCTDGSFCALTVTKNLVS